jgi:hypothetical protein
LIKAINEDDPFDRLLAGWLALVILARHNLSEWNLPQPTTDRVTLITYFERTADNVVAVLDDHQADVRWLAQRTGSHTGRAILDVIPDRHPEHLRGLFDDLSRAWLSQWKRSPTFVARATAEVLNTVRNNTFHGGKAPEDSDDQQLLYRINNILVALLKSGL